MKKIILFAVLMMSATAHAGASSCPDGQIEARATYSDCERYSTSFERTLCVKKPTCLSGTSVSPYTITLYTWNGVHSWENTSRKGRHSVTTPDGQTDWCSMTVVMQACAAAGAEYEKLSKAAGCNENNGVDSSAYNPASGKCSDQSTYEEDGKVTFCYRYSNGAALHSCRAYVFLKEDYAQGFYARPTYCPRYCELCDDSLKCTQCMSGYIEKNGECVEEVSCPSNCAECDSSGVCTKCDSGYVLKNGVCAVKPKTQVAFCPPDKTLTADLCCCVSK